MGMDIDEARCDGHSVTVEFFRAGTRDFADLGDLAAPHRDVADERHATVTIHDGAAADNDVEFAGHAWAPCLVGAVSPREGDPWPASPVPNRLLPGRQVPVIFRIAWPTTPLRQLGTGTQLIIVCLSAPIRRLTARLHTKEATSMTIDVATGISRILKQEGVGLQVSATFPVCRVNNALGREGVPMLMMRDDRYAVAVADAFSRITAGSRIGVCTFQGGVNAAGMQYAYAGLAQAYEDGSPVLCITDGVPAGSSGNSQSAMSPAGHEDRVDKEVVRLSRQTRAHPRADAPGRFTMLRSTTRPGPVHPAAIPNATATYDETADPYRLVKGWKSAPDQADVRAAVDRLLAARNPLIYAGEGVVYAGASEDLVALAELVNVPVITTLKAKGALPETHELFVGVRGDQVAHYLNKSDVILAVGTSLSPGRFSHAIPDAAKKTIIHCNVDELQDINKMYPTGRTR